MISAPRSHAAAALAVPAGRVRVLHAGVDHDELEAGIREAEIDDGCLERAAVEEDRRVGAPEHRRHLVHDPGRGARPPRSRRCGRPGRARRGRARAPTCRSAPSRRRPRSPPTTRVPRRSARRTRSPGRRRVRMPHPPTPPRQQRPRDAERVGRPLGHVAAVLGEQSASSAGELDLDGLVLDRRDHADAPVSRASPSATCVRCWIANGSTNPSL